MRKLIYAILLTNPMDTLIFNPEPIDTAMIDTIMVDPEPTDTTMVDPEPMDTTMVDPEPMDTTMVDPEPVDTTMVDPEPMDTTMVDPEPMDKLMVNGLTYANSDKTFEEANLAIIEALNALVPVKVVAEIDHTENAASVDQILNPTKVILFGNPMLGTPLMQKNQLAGLDLPQKLLLFQNDNEQLKVAYNSTDYLTQRHGLQGVESLNAIASALANFSRRAATEELIIGDTSVDLMEGIVSKTSRNSFEKTYEKLINLINLNEIKIITELDHQANAASVNLELPPTKLVIFGNPNLGTPLMQSSQTVGIDLPQKMLVFENEAGEVQVAYSDPDFLAKRHGLTDNENELKMVSNVLHSLSIGSTN